jgi:prepilin-type N-terminal cleavage/methylation domain-containing protein
MNTKYQQAQRAFTLIELLTVIAIIGILAAILIPTVGKVRGTARDAACLSNVRQIVMAQQLFADSNKDYFTSGYLGVDTWQQQLEPYVGVNGKAGREQAFHMCPRYDGPAPVVGSGETTYALNYEITGAPKRPKRSNITRRLFLVMDRNLANDDYVDGSKVRSGDVSYYRHGSNNRITIGFTDASVASLVKEQVNVSPNPWKL